MPRRRSATNLKAPAQEAAAAVKDTAADAVDSVKADAQYAAGEVKDQARAHARTSPATEPRSERRRRVVGAPASRQWIWSQPTA